MLPIETLRNIVLIKEETNKLFSDLEKEISEINPEKIDKLDFSIFKHNRYIKPPIHIYQISDVRLYIQGTANFSSEIPANKARGRTNAVELGYLTWNVYQLLVNKSKLNKSLLTPYSFFIPIEITRLDQDYNFKLHLETEKKQLNYILGLYDENKLIAIHKGLGTK